MTAPSPEKILKRVEKSQSIRDTFEQPWTDVIDLMLPMFDNFRTHELTGGHNMDRIYDSAPVTGAMEFASRLVSGITPLHERWFELESGSSVPEDQREKLDAELKEVADYVFQRIVESNFSSAMQDAALNLGIGTCNLAVDEGILPERPLTFTAYGHPEILLDNGPFREPDGRFIPTKKTWEDLQTIYGEKNLRRPNSITDLKPDTELKCVESVTRDWQNRGTDAYWRQLILCEDGSNNRTEALFEQEIKGLGSNPIITARWSAGTAAPWGRGPFIFALPDVKSLNYVIELIFQNAEMAISGIWQYENDGVFNADNIEMVPGTVVAKRKGSKGLEPLESPARFDVAQFMLNDQRDSVARAQYNRQFTPAGKTPLSSTETNERKIDLIEQIGLSIVNLIRELAYPIVTRSVYILKKKGLIELPKINGREVKIVAVSPLAKALQQGRIIEFVNFLSIIRDFFGEQALQVYVNVEHALAELRKWHNVDPRNLRTKAQQKEFIQQFQAAAQQMSQNAQQ